MTNRVADASRQIRSIREAQLRSRPPSGMFIRWLNSLRLCPAGCGMTLPRSTARRHSHVRRCDGKEL